MTPAEVAAKLRVFNDWRRGGDIEYPGPLAVDEAIDAAVEMIERLEAAEKARDDVARQLVQSEQGKRKISEECDALRNEIACVKEVEFPRKAQAVADAWKGKCERLEAECDALRAKIAEMERQEPVGEIQRANSTGNYICSEVWVPLPVGAKLYALPGAKGDEK